LAAAFFAAAFFAGGFTVAVAPRFAVLVETESSSIGDRLLTATDDLSPAWARE
jgi:hypothetical protein